MCDDQQPPSTSAPMTSALYVYKMSSGRYLLSIKELPEDRVATFDNAGGHLPAILMKLTPQDDKTVSEPLDIILAVVHSQMAADLREDWTEHLEPCHRDAAMKATDIKKAVKRKIGKTASQELLQSFRERILHRSGHATRLLLNPYGQCVTLRT